MNASTPLLYYVLYAAPFVVAAIVLISAKISDWRAKRDAELVEKPIITPEDPMIAEIRSHPMRGHYATYSRSAH